MISFQEQHLPSSNLPFSFYLKTGIKKNDEFVADSNAINK
jgi:hypothetical protein